MCGWVHEHRDCSRRTHTPSWPISLRPFASRLRWCCPGCSRSLLVRRRCTVANIGPTAALNPIDFYRSFWQCVARLRGVLPCTPIRHPILLSLFPLDHNLVLHGKGSKLERRALTFYFPVISYYMFPLLKCRGGWDLGLCVTSGLAKRMLLRIGEV